MKRLLFIALTIAAQVITCATQLCAQDENIQKEYDAHTEYTYAERYYEYGYFDIALSYLDKLQDSADATIRSSAYRLKALCHIEMGDIEKAKEDVQKLLSNDPYFSPSATVNPIFLNLVNSSKKIGSATITTASQQAETIEESPVPVTLITEDMLKAIGARTVKDALIAYVPGMTDIASNEEMNIAMRGIYGTTQEKILFMINGHRLNSNTTNAFSPDYSMSLDKIKQIEVLRGPASSIYGGVALTAVVNILTKDGNDIDGIKVKGSVGNHGQYHGSLLMGKNYYRMNVSAWANITSVKGEEIYMSPADQHYGYNILAGIEQGGNIYIDKFTSRPAYDIGASIKWNNFTFFYNTTHSNKAPTYTLSPMFSPYTYGKFMSINNEGPGNSTTSHILKLDFTKSFNNLTLSAIGSYDIKEVQQYQVLGDTIPDLGGYDIIIPNGTNEMVKITRGYFQSLRFHESVLNLKVMANYSYKSANHKGNILLGAHFADFRVNDSYYEEGDEFNRILKVYNDSKNLYTGKETEINGFIQLKHSWKERFILNAGLRFDHKRRMTIDDYMTLQQGINSINILSPRIAFIYNQNKWNVKLSYSKAYVDAPYYYRNNMLDVNFGVNLQPEYLHSTQLSVSRKDILKNLDVEANIFYNSLDNYIFNDVSLGFLANGGEFENIGAEFIATYKTRKLFLTGNLVWQKMLSSENFATVDEVLCNIPSFLANITCSYKVLPNLDIHANASHTSKVKSIAMTLENLPIDIPAKVLLGIGANYNIKKFELAFDVHNVLNTKYEVGGNVTAPIRQQGLWCLASIGYKF